MNNTPQSRHRHARPKGCRSCALDRTGTLPKTPQQWASVIAYEASPFTDALAGLSTTELSASFARFNDKVEQARLGKRNASCYCSSSERLPSRTRSRLSSPGASLRM